LLAGFYITELQAVGVKPNVKDRFKPLGYQPVFLHFEKFFKKHI